METSHVAHQSEKAASNKHHSLTVAHSNYSKMSAKHQENDAPVKASHLLLVIAVCQVLVPEHCLLGEPPKHEKFVSFHKSSVEWWPFVTYPAPRAAPTV